MFQCFSFYIDQVQQDSSVVSVYFGQCLHLCDVFQSQWDNGGKCYTIYRPLGYFYTGMLAQSQKQFVCDPLALGCRSLSLLSMQHVHIKHAQYSMPLPPIAFNARHYFCICCMQYNVPLNPSLTPALPSLAHTITMATRAAFHPVTQRELESVRLFVKFTV